MRQLILLTSLSFLAFAAGASHADALQATPKDCPSVDDAFGGTDDAHILLELSHGRDYAKLVKETLQELQATEPKMQKVEFLEKNYGKLSRPVFSYRTGQMRLYHFHEEEVVEFVVVRPFSDCAPPDKSYESDKKRYIVSRAFSDNSLNVALVKVFLHHGIPMRALSPTGKSWICTNLPTHESCAKRDL